MSKVVDHHEISIVSTGSPPPSDYSPLHSEREEKYQTKKLYFAVTGMTCGVCSGTIETALKGAKGVVDAGVSHVNKLARVVFVPSETTPEKIIEVITDVGFEAELQRVDSEGKTVLLAQKTIEDIESVESFVKNCTGVLKVSIEPTVDARIGNTSRLDIEFDLHQTGPRNLMRQLETKGVLCILAQSKGSLELRKDEMVQKSQAEIKKHSGSFLWSLLFTLPVLFINMICPYIPVIHEWLQCPIYNGFRVQGLLLWCLVTPVQFYLGRHFYTASYHSIKNKSASMDVLIMIGSTASYLYSTITLVLCMFNDHYDGPMFFETSAVLISIVLLGRCVEHKAKGKTADALTALMSLQVPHATIVEMNEEGKIQKEEVIPTNLVQYGDIVKVLPGDKMPVDGIVIRGKTTVDESLVTGESMPVPKDIHQTVIGSTVNLDSTIYFKATGIGSDTMLSKIAQLVDDAQTSKAPIQAYADKIAKYFVPTVVMLSILTIAIWFTLFRLHVAPSSYLPSNVNDFLFSFMFGIAVLVISCPCSLGLATPTAVYVASLVGVKNGVLFRGGQPLEETRHIKKVLFDKTGTLTQGKPSVNSQQTITMHKELNITPHELWSILGSAEVKSDHLLGKAIVNFAKEFTGLDELENPDEYKPTTGAGIYALVKGKKVVIGSLRFMAENGVGVDASVIEKILPMQDQGHIVVLAGFDRRLAAVVSISDAIRAEARLVIQHLRNRGIESYLVTGDHERSANSVANSIGIPRQCVRAQVSPQKKAEIVKEVQATEVNNPTAKVAFIGDGVNDAPALAKSDIGVAMRGGTDIAVEAAQIVLNRNDLTDLLVAMDLSNLTMSRIKRNFLWAFTYNILAIPLAGGAFYPFWHAQLSPMIAAVLMFISSISVVASSYLLNRFKKTNYHGIGYSGGEGENQHQQQVSVRVVGEKVFSSLPTNTPSYSSQPAPLVSPESLSPEMKYNKPEVIDWRPLRTRHVSISGHESSASEDEEEEEVDQKGTVELVGLLNPSSISSDSSSLNYASSSSTTLGISQALVRKMSSMVNNMSPLVTDEP